MAWEIILSALLALSIGIAFCFNGYKWFMILLPIYGFLLGFTIGAGSVSGFYGQSIFSLMVIIVAGLIVGLLLATAAYLFFDFAVIILGATIGYSFGAGIAINIGFETGFIPVVAGILTATAVAFLAIRLHLPKYIIITLTALIGASAIISGILILTGQESLSILKYGIFGIIAQDLTSFAPIDIALAVVGFVIQLRGSRDYELDIPSENAENSIRRI